MARTTWSRVSVGFWSVSGILCALFIFALVFFFDNQYDGSTKGFLSLLALVMLVGCAAGLRTAFRGSDLEVEKLDEDSGGY